MNTFEDMTMAEREVEFRHIMDRLVKAESILVGGLDNPSPGLVHTVTQLAQVVANQGTQIAKLQDVMQDSLAKKMDVVVDEMNQPVSVSILAHDVSEIRKILQRVLLWLAGIGFAALLLLGRTAYNVFPQLQEMHK